MAFITCEFLKPLQTPPQSLSTFILNPPLSSSTAPRLTAQDFVTAHQLSYAFRLSAVTDELQKKKRSKDPRAQQRPLANRPPLTHSLVPQY